jgi:tetratricopeptide (TPR) repeat protein
LRVAFQFARARFRAHAKRLAWTGEERMKSSVIVFLLFLALSAGTAAADPLEECQGNAWPNVQLNACTDIITSAAFDPHTKAIAYRFRGEIRNNAGAFKAAIADFDESIKLQADNVAAFAGRAQANVSLGRYADAIAGYSDAIRLSPSRADLYIERGHASLLLGNLDASIRDLTTAIERDPRNAVAFNNRGLAFRMKREFDKAYRDYSAAIAINPAYALAYANRGRLQVARGNKKPAVADLKQALLLDPSLVDARKALGALGSLSSITAEVDERVREGRELAANKCNGCHATGPDGTSANPRAPEFRNLSRRYPLLALRKPIARGVVAQHENMPQFQLTAYQVDTIIAYINSLSATK